MPNPAKLLQLINSGAGPLWLRFSAVVIGVLGEMDRWRFVLSESSTIEIQPWSGLWSFLFSWNWMFGNIFHVLQNIFIFSLSVFLSLHIFSFFFSSLFTLFHPKLSFSARWKVWVKPYWSSSRLTVRAGKLWKTFFQCCNLLFLFIVCHYLLQPFIPSPSWSFPPQYRFNALIPLFYLSQECYSGSPVLFSCQLPVMPYFSTKEGEIWFKSGSFLLSDSGSQALGTVHSPSYGTCLYLHSHLLVKHHQPPTRYSSRFIKFGSGSNPVNFGRRDVPECVSLWPVETDAIASSTWEVPTCGLGMDKWFFVPCTSFIFLLCCMNILDQNNKKKKIVGVGGGCEVPKCHSDHGRWCLSYTGPLLAGAITLPVVWAPTLNRSVTPQILQTG